MEENVFVNREHGAKEFNKFLKRCSGLSDRDMLIIGMAFLEEILGNILEKRLICNKSFFSIKPKKQQFAERIRLAYSTGVLMRKNCCLLHKMSEIRNKFAHVYDLESLNDEKLNDSIDSICDDNKDILENVYSDIAYVISQKEEWQGCAEIIKEELSAKKHKLKYLIAAQCYHLTMIFHEIKPISPVYEEQN